MKKLLMMLGLLLAGTSTVQAQTCQNVSGIQATPTLDAQWHMFDNNPRDGRIEGIECEMTMTFVGGTEGSMDGLVPPSGHYEGIEHRIPASPPTTIVRELGVNPDLGNSSMTVYRMVFERTNGSAARAPELELALESVANHWYAVLYWRTFTFGQSQTWQGTVTRLDEALIEPGKTVGCANAGVPVCLRTRWDATVGGTAKLTVQLDTWPRQSAPKVVQLNSNYSKTPSLRMGYLGATAGTDRDGIVSIDHRVMCMTSLPGASPGVPVCPPLQ